MMKPLFILLLPFIGIFLPLASAKANRTICAWLTALPVLISLGLLLSLTSAVFDGVIPTLQLPWLPQFGLNFTLRFDGFAFLFALLVLGIGLLIILYARYYLSEQDPMGRFYAMLLLFMGSMLGVVTAGNLLLLAVFWELTSLSSFLLIGYWQHRADARQGARMALIVTGGGGLAMLAGLLLLGHIAGSYELAEVLAAGAQIKASPLYLPALLLILLGAFTKSAQFPFHFWLPHAMAAPTPVSAYLHSATMVKAGVFLLARLFPALAGTIEWTVIVSLIGAATLVFAAYVAFFKHDLKSLLAYSTVSHLGLITLLFGLGTPLGAVAGIFHILNHATFKASLFMAAGIVDHEAGTRDIRQLGGLRRYMPHTALLATVAAAAMAGVPLLNGFLSKEMFFTEVWMQNPLGASWSWILVVAAVVGGLFSVAYSVRLVHDVFYGSEPATFPRQPHEPPRYMRIPVEVLVTLCLLVGIIPTIIVGPLLAAGVNGVLLGATPEYSLAIWHGFNIPLLMSAMALIGGVLVYRQRRQLFALHGSLLPSVSAKQIFDRWLQQTIALARLLTGLLDTGSLQRYVLLMVLATIAIGLLPLLGHWPGLPAAPPTPITPMALVVWFLLVVGVISVLSLHRHRITALVTISIVGLMVVISFGYLSGPDLALTQLSVEVVTTLLMLLALNMLPKTTPRESRPARRLRDGMVAAVGGLGVGAISYAVLTRDFAFPSTSLYHLLLSKPEGGGTNVVNVILVDFRGFDTFGEISVLGIAALGIYAMLNALRHGTPQQPTPREMESHYPLILAQVTRLLLPLALLVAAYIFLRGHNQPGGGFVAGLVASVALIMQYMASGEYWSQQRLRHDYRLFIGLGVLAAGITGMVSWAFGSPFLTSAFSYVVWPLVGEFEVASAIGFDLGVFLTVVGSITLMLVNLGTLRTGVGRGEESA